MKKKLLLTLFIALFAVMAFANMTVSAEIYEYLHYEIYYDEVEIVGCDESVAGEIVIPDTIDGYPVTSIYGAFSECSLITSVTIPDSVTYIGDGTFFGCTGLTSVTIGSGVEAIEEQSFANCTNLKYVGLSATVDFIGDEAFHGCINLKTVFYEGGKSQWDRILIENDVYSYDGVSSNHYLLAANVIYNSKKKTYSFVTNCDTPLADIETYALYTLPVINVEGATIDGWYDNEELSGDPINFPYYGDAKTLYAKWAEGTGASFEDAFIADVYKTYNVITTGEEQLVYFKFEPTQSKEYWFYSAGPYDTLGYLYNSDMSQLRYNNNSGDDDNFFISYDMKAGETYYIAVKLAEGVGTFSVITETGASDIYTTNSITIKDTSGNELTTIPNDSFLATISFTNLRSTEDSVVVLSLYSKDGSFKGLMYASAEDVPMGSTIKISIPVDNKNCDIATLKAFCIDSFGSFVPLGSAASYYAQ